MATSKFFEERSDQSEIKARIVQKYFWAWARVIIPTAKKHGNKVAYIDLYAGPGRYKDGAASTPLLVLETAIEDPTLARMLVGMFNDMDKDKSQTLREEIANLPGIKKLKYKPIVQANEIGADAEKFFSESRLIPSFTFFDPFGYKGLSLGIIRGVIKDWGCDCVFFFNYNRINAGIDNPKVDEHMTALFGEATVEKLRKLLVGKTPSQREAIILEEMSQAIKGMGGRYVLPFRFKNAQGTRTSHCLIFVSKHELGYRIMKGIMASESSVTDQGVPSFTYSPAEASTPLLFSLARPLDQLEGLLLKAFKGQKLTMEQIFARHHVDTPYMPKNYKDALRNLESKKKITCNPPAEERRKVKGGRYLRRRCRRSIPLGVFAMADNSSIEWTEATWNPVVGCTILSPGCTNCYAMRLASRLEAMGQQKYAGTTRISGGRAKWNGRINLDHGSLHLPRTWRTGKIIFVNSMSDLFHEGVPLAFIQEVFATMVSTPHHTYQVLTKRAERLEALSPHLPWSPNVWMGVSVESKDYLPRVDCLRRTGAAVKFLSLEPLLGPLDCLDLHRIDWAIAGGESGPSARPMLAEWVRSIRDQCTRAGVAFHFKQWGGPNKKKTGRVLDGRTWDEFPRAFARRQQLSLASA